MQSLTLSQAQELLAHGVDQMRHYPGKTACFSVCDQHGFLISFSRMDGAPVRSIQLAQQKAYTCARIGTSTDAFLARLRREDIPITYFCDPLLTALPGGAVLIDKQGSILGGVGVSGLAPTEDQAIADKLAAIMSGSDNQKT
ncbi:GlcG/HbpS family heme-binding protein [Pollutimonas harenae]|uniref:Heme-binding protein n=1 Tax=Pollutimonas harenae TaxID=657015 RepID=A0A853H0W0_9BURK|nr:heme-binding protein [Pollutimonas harenae]NYT85379.1 heme-binding protein [Pollutimonas harenae]TEA70478.1 heme-binding protein [Pollutimonas harenae]